MINLRKANIHDLPIPKYWDTKEHVIKSDHGDDWNREIELQRELLWRVQLDNVVYLDYRAKELENLKNGRKIMIIRGAMGRKLPYGRVQKGDVLYLAENNGTRTVIGMAVVDAVFNSELLTKEESIVMVDKNQDKLLLDGRMKKRFAGKRYLVLIEVKDFEDLEPFRIDRSAYKNMDDWLPVESIENIKFK